MVEKIHSLVANAIQRFDNFPRRSFNAIASSPNFNYFSARTFQVSIMKKEKNRKHSPVRARFRNPYTALRQPMLGRFSCSAYITIRFENYILLQKEPELSIILRARSFNMVAALVSQMERNC